MRREFVGQAARLLLGAALPLAFGCRSGGLSCNDEDALSTPERALRASQGYAEASPYGEDKSCAGCQFFQAAAAGECGHCQIMNGPVNPAGHCNSWAARA